MDGNFFEYEALELQERAIYRRSVDYPWTYLVAGGFIWLRNVFLMGLHFRNADVFSLLFNIY